MDVKAGAESGRRLCAAVFCCGVFILQSAVSAGCTVCAAPQKSGRDSSAVALYTQQLRVVSWNVQTFFDAVTDGNEYKEFRKKGAWTRAAYETRLDRLCAVLKNLDADVCVLEELENAGQLHDIYNRMTGFDLRKQYTHGCFARSPGSSIGCGILSRFPLENMSVHALCVCERGVVQPELRPVMEVTVCRGEAELTLFVNHWKSKSGGKNETERWRNLQESVLSARIRRLCSGADLPAVLVCGDFNRDINDFAGDGCGSVLLRSSGSGSAGVTVHSPWYCSDGTLTEPGSYYFQNRWERIDSFFVCGAAALTEFSPEYHGEWADDKNVPRGYKIWNGEGYSDHLPISCTVQF